MVWILWFLGRPRGESSWMKSEQRNMSMVLVKFTDGPMGGEEREVQNADVLNVEYPGYAPTEQGCRTVTTPEGVTADSTARVRHRPQVRNDVRPRTTRSRRLSLRRSRRSRTGATPRGKILRKRATKKPGERVVSSSSAPTGGTRTELHRGRSPVVGPSWGTRTLVLGRRALA
jgi:hypothetical protein